MHRHMLRAFTGVLAVTLSVTVFFLGISPSRVAEAQTTGSGGGPSAPGATGTTESPRISAQAASAAASVWTPAAMAQAKPITPSLTLEQVAQVSAASSGAPLLGQGKVAGGPPGSGDPAAPTSSPFSPTAGIAPVSYTYPAPHSNFAWFGSYATRPVSTVGAMNITTPTGGARCSAAVIGPNHIFTAGHCVSNGAGTFYSNWVFCPQYDAGSCTRGQFTAINCVVANGWHLSGGLERDLAGCRMNSSGGQSVSQVAGNFWHGVSWNWGLEHPDSNWVQLGYPAEAPYNGNKIRANISSWAYNLSHTSQTPDSFAVGSSNNGGASGGPFIRDFGWPAPAIDPGSNGLNGVHSYTRLDSNGARLKEMASPYFDTVACQVYDTVRDDTTIAC